MDRNHPNRRTPQIQSSPSVDRVSAARQLQRRPVPPEFAGHVPPALERVSVPAYILDRDGRIQWLNPAAEAITGDAVGRLFTDVLGPEDVGGARPIFERNLRGAPHPDFSIDLVRPDGEATRVQISSAALGPVGSAVGMFGLVLPAAPGDTGGRTRSDKLTRRQHDVLELLAEGASTDQIAERLVVSRETVRNHVRHILQRLHARSRLEAVAIAHREGLL
jgi:DNA-binding CsgD family transcriptional regulator